MSQSPASDTQLLVQIRDLLGQQLAAQESSMALQRRQFEMVSEQFERAKALQSRAEDLQQRSQGMIETARKLLLVIIPVIAFLIGLVIWYLV